MNEDIKLNSRNIINFWSHIKKDSNLECWEWQASKSKDGYGIFGINGKTYRSHRVSWTIHFGGFQKAF